MPRPKQFLVTLTEDDRVLLSKMLSSGTHPAQVLRRARTLLELDESSSRADDRAVIAERVGVSEATVLNVAKRFAAADGDPVVAITNKERAEPPVPSQITGDVEARLIQLACSKPPTGYARWSLRLLEKHVVLIDDVPNLDHSTIGKVLKKRNFVLI